MAIDWTKLPSLTALRAFDATVQSGSFSAAARSLNVTHAAVAQQVKALETHLGLPLLLRSPRGITPTPEGQRLAQSLQSGFTAINDGVLSAMEQGGQQPVRVTTTAYFAESVIFPRIADFWLEHPDTEIAFTPTDRAVDLVAEGFDLAVRAGEGGWPDLDARRLLQSPTLALASPRLVDDPATNWQDIPWLIPHEDTWERDVLRQSGIDPAQIRTIDVGNPALEIRAAEQGMGLLLESQVDVARQLDQGSLKVAPIQIQHVSSYFIVTPPWPPRRNVQTFIKWLLRAISEDAPASGSRS